MIAILEGFYLLIFLRLRREKGLCILNGKKVESASFFFPLLPFKKINSCMSLQLYVLAASLPYPGQSSYI